jgi:hypothetical protein
MAKSKRIEITLSNLFNKNAKIAEEENYINEVLKIAGEGNEVVLTGQAPVWLYLKIAHALHGKAKRLIYKSPVTGEIEIFDHRID